MLVELANEAGKVLPKDGPHEGDQPELPPDSGAKTRDQKTTTSGRTWPDLAHEFIFANNLWNIILRYVFGVLCVTAFLVYLDLIHVDTAKGHYRLGWDHDRIKEEREREKQGEAATQSVRWREYWSRHLNQTWSGSWSEKATSQSVEGDAASKCEARWDKKIVVRFGVLDPERNYGTGEASVVARKVATVAPAPGRPAPIVRDRCFKSAGVNEDGFSELTTVFFLDFELDGPKGLVVIRFVQTNCVVNCIRNTVRMSIQPNGELDYGVTNSGYDYIVRMVPERALRRPE